MRKIWAATVAACLLTSAWSFAAAPTVADKAAAVETAVYGQAQTGALLERVEQAERTVYGGTLREEGLAEQVDSLYGDVIIGEANEPSLVTKLNTLEWQLHNEISHVALLTRVESLENSVYGEVKQGSLRERIGALEVSVYRNRHFELRELTMPANTVFPIRLEEAVGTETSQVGDVVNFSVATDVFVDDVLVLPRGAKGEGVITKVKKPRSFGRQGELEISFDQVFAIDDQPIATVLGPEAKEKLKREAAAIGASAAGAMILGPIGLVGGLFIRGSEVEMPAGTELYIQVQEAVQTHGVVAVDGAPQMREKDIVVDSRQRAGELNAESKERAREKTKSDVKETKEQVAEDTAAVREEAADKAEEAKDNLAAKAEEVKEDASTKAADLQKEAKEKAAEVTDSAAEKKDEAVVEIEKIEENNDDEHLPVVVIRQE